MSKRTIAVTIDANAKTCGGRCPHRSPAAHHYSVCFLFDSSIYKSERCEKCLAAEKAYKEATHGKA